MGEDGLGVTSCHTYPTSYTATTMRHYDDADQEAPSVASDGRPAVKTYQPVAFRNCALDGVLATILNNTGFFAAIGGMCLQSPWDWIC